MAVAVVRRVTRDRDELLEDSTRRLLAQFGIVAAHLLDEALVVFASDERLDELMRFIRRCGSSSG
jgi:hypothetical protein